MLVLYPLLAGCILALLEPLHVNRFLGHMASAGLGFASCLFAWSRWKPIGGVALGLVIGALVHSFLNTAYYWPLSSKGPYQFYAALGLLTLGIWILWRAARKEPASEIASELFPSAMQERSVSGRGS